MEYIFVLNPAAGKNRAALSLIPTIQKICSKHKISPQIYISQSGDDICEYVKNACAGKQRRVYALGGDGTLSRVINGCGGNENADTGVNEQFRVGIQRHLRFLQHCAPFSRSAGQTKAEKRKAGNREDGRSYAR